MNGKWVAPFSYWLGSRFPTRLEKCSFIALFPLPLAACLWVQTRNLAFLGPFALGFVAFACLYEIGYLQNDVCTTRREAAPTFRLPAAERERVAHRLLLLIGVRIAVLAAMLALLTLFPQAHVVRFSAALGFVLIAFTLHNTLRSRANVATYALLCAGKYAALPLLLLDAPWPTVAALFLAFCLPRSLEHATKPKYGFARLDALLGDHDAFRVRYYLLLTPLAFALHPRFGALLAYFLLFRVLTRAARGM